MHADLNTGWNNIKNVTSIGVGKAASGINGQIDTSGNINYDGQVSAVGIVAGVGGVQYNPDAAVVSGGACTPMD